MVGMRLAAARPVVAAADLRQTLKNSSLELSFHSGTVCSSISGSGNSVQRAPPRPYGLRSFARGLHISGSRASDASGYHFPIINPFLRAGPRSERQRYLDVFQFDRSGKYNRARILLSSIQDLHTRDLVAISHETGRRAAPVILVRKKTIIVSLSHVKALISCDGMYLLDIHRPVVRNFAENFSQYLMWQQQLEGQTQFEIEEELDSAGHLPPSVKDPLHMQKSPAEPKPQSDFEMVLLEGILRFVCDKYDRRMRCFRPVIAEVLINIDKEGEIDEDMIRRLIPLKNSLSAFESSTNELLKCLQETLSSDEDMLEMLLSEKKRLKGNLPPQQRHQEVELLLETYHREIADLNNEAYVLRKQIQNTQVLVSFALDAYRNRMMKMNMHLQMGTVGLTFGALTASTFGMNLVSGFEHHAYAFYSVAGFSFFSVCMIFLYLRRLSAFWGSAATGASQRQKNVADLKSLHMLMDQMGDVQDIVLESLNRYPRQEVDKEAFRQILAQASGNPVSGRTVDKIFSLFDHNSDGVMDRPDVIRFLCEQQSQRDLGPSDEI